MNQPQIIGSGGGKSGGGGGGISEDADTLSSVAFARIVELIGEGRIHGLVNGDYSIYLDGVPLRNLEGTPNYRPFKWSFTPGTQNQLPILGFSGTQQETGVSVQLFYSSGKIVRSVADADADSVRVTLSVNGLSQTSDKGKVTGAKVAYRISVRRSVSGTWITAYDGAIDGKTGSKYQKAHEVNLESLGAGPYQVAVERLTADSASALLINDLFWDSFTVINYEQYAYPNSAIAALEMDARYFGSIPARTYHVKGLLVRIPSNYNPVSRIYTGTWDGTWQTDYTNNPAWCFYDIVTHPRYGLGERISDDQISKWDMYAIAKYCDEAVPTGVGGNEFDVQGDSSFSGDGKANAGVPVRTGPTEPRFTLNCVINTRDDAYRVLANLSSVFRGMVFWSTGSASVTQDRPTAPSMLWNNANVIDGMFSYEGSSRAQRHTTVTVGWNDPSEDFKQKFEYVEDREGIARYGVRPLDTIAFGCTSQSQARRVGLYILFTERVEKDAVSFKVGLDSAAVRPGDVGQIMDYKRAGARWGGRLLSTTSTTVTLDAPLELIAGTYTLSTLAPDGTIITKSVVLGASGTFSVLTVSVAFAVQPTNLAIWTLASTVVTPMLGRVVSIKQETQATWSIVCLQHDPAKFNAIELASPLSLSNYSFLSYSKVAAVTGLVATEASFKTAVSGNTITNLDISWDTPSDPLVRGYRIRVNTTSGLSTTFPEQAEPFHTMQGLTPDTYTIDVWAINTLGASSPVASTTTVVTGIDTRVPGNVANFSYAAVPGGIKFTWDKLVDISYMSTSLHVESVWSNATVALHDGDSNTYTWDWPAPGTYTVLAKHRDTSNNLSTTAASVSITVGASSLIPWSGVTGDGRPLDTKNYDFVQGTDGWVGISSVVTSTSASGGKAALTAGTPSEILMSSRPIPIQLGRTYKVRTRVTRDTGSGGTLYAGVLCYDSAGTLLSNFGGSTYPYCAAHAVSVPVDSVWHDFEGVISGQDAIPSPTAGPEKFWAGTVTAVPMLFTYGSWVGPLGVDYLEIIDVTEAEVAVGAAATATATAAAAASYASTALAALSDISSDSILSPFEKPAIVQDYTVIISEQTGIDNQAAAYSITTERTAYNTAVADLVGYLASGPLSGWNTVPGLNVAIVGTTFRSKFAGVYIARQVLLDKFVERAKALADAAQGTATTGVTNAATAQTTANTAVTNAATAQATANTAVTSAATANTAIANIGSDSILSPSEKPSIAQDYAVITSEQAGIAARATAYSITTEKTAYDSAVSALTTYLGGLTGWNTIPGGDVAIVGATFRSKFADVYTTRQTVLNKIAEVAGTLAAWSGVSGVGRPADNATSDVVLVGGGVVVTGNSATKVTGVTAWDAHVYSLDSYVGGAFASAVPPSTSHWVMFGLNSDPTLDTGYTSIDYAMYTAGSGDLYAYESGVSYYLGTYTAGQPLAVTYDGTKIRYMKGGAALRTVTVAIVAPLFFDSSFNTVGARLDSIRFGPMSSNAWASVGGSGKPQDNATVGAISGTNIYDSLGNLLTDASTNPIIADLVPNTWVLPADSSGVVSSFAGATATLALTRAGIDDSSNWTFSRTESDVSITTSQSGSPTGVTVSVTAISSVVDVGYVDVTATPGATRAAQGYVATTRRLSLTKSKAAPGSTGPVPSMGTLFVGVFGAFPGTYTAGLRFESNGTVSERTAGSYVAYGANWYLPTTTSIGSGYWIRVDKLSGDAPSFGSLGVWQQLSAARSWEYTVSSGTKEGFFQFNIATSSAGTTVVCSGQLSIYCESTP